MPLLLRILKLLTLSAAFLMAGAQQLGLTFDDGLNPDTEPHAPRWSAQILAGLRQAELTAMAFPSLARTGEGQGLALIRQWAEAGHAIGNHTASHRSLSLPSITLAGFIADVDRTDAVFGSYPNRVPLLRFPYLKEGNSVERRDGMRAWMQAHGYRAAPVSIDASDGYYDQVYAAHIAKGDTDRASRVKRAYIQHLLDRASYYEALAVTTLGRSPAHVLRLHTNQINADALGEIVAAFRARDWTLVNPCIAFDDPLYARQPETLPAGETIVWALARQAGHAGLRYPAEDSTDEAPVLCAQGLLP
ncbi:polysaccharide deacetylase [Stenotrophomonas pictorum JCM 9942]|uniref:Polysaccharide deacetylase n=1 Tax=Stenotrophomonas pictorum JCM 9942 TaxID=1236960 RepID=A0A0R0A9P7_9GAMM|nr:polysaccharide deacetylase family protein [Stenotrophomonas pictorum]KRG41589.1 polysaccharide deacetylase [Stenotrophomonas pictorum JCM 9942]